MRKNTEFVTFHVDGKVLYEKRGQRKRARSVQGTSKVTHINTLYNYGEQKKHLSIHKTINLVSGLQRQKTISDSTYVSKVQVSEAIMTLVSLTVPCSKLA